MSSSSCSSDHVVGVNGCWLPETSIAAIRPGGDASALPEPDRSILRWTDELIDEHGLCEASRAAALRVLSTTQLVDFVFTVGYYQLVCNFLNTFGVVVEGGAAPAVPAQL